MHILYEPDNQNWGIRGVLGPSACTKLEKQKSRLLISALPLLWSGCASTEKWQLPLPCPRCCPTEPRRGAGGRRKTEGCTQLSQTCGWVILKTQKQILVSADVALPHKHKCFGHWSADRNCMCYPVAGKPEVTMQLVFKQISCIADSYPASSWVWRNCPELNSSK